MMSDRRAGGVEELLQQIREWLADSEDGLKDADHDHGKDHRPPDTMQEERIEARCPYRRGRTTVAGVSADPHCPFAITTCAADDGQLQRLGAGRGGRKKILHGLK